MPIVPAMFDIQIAASTAVFRPATVVVLMITKINKEVNEVSPHELIYYYPTIYYLLVVTIHQSLSSIVILFYYLPLDLG